MILGIDTASVAGNKKIDWTAAKAAGLSFALLRAAYGVDTDSTFTREWPRLAESGLMRGAYLFLRFPRGNKKAPEPSGLSARCEKNRLEWLVEVAQLPVAS